MSGDRRLLVRGFPYWLRDSEKTSLLRHFGATEVVALPTRGKMRNCVFATFASVEDAKRALGRLHQLEVLGSRLVVEYVHDKLPHLQRAHGDGGGSEETEDALPSPTPVILPPPPPPPAPRLSYSYPPPSLSTLTNITHTLVTIPKFYEQVLHLMNLMNLPPPFGPVTPAPPGLEGGLGGREEERGESEAESEVGSGEDSHPERMAVREVKRRTAHLTSTRGVSPPAKRRHNQPHFDSAAPLQVGGVRKIAFHVPSKIEPRPPDVSTIVSTTTINVSPQLPGKSSHDQQEEFEEEKAEEEEEEEEEERFISSEELAQNRLSDREMQEMSVFRGYSPGEPSLRLYIKNLSRQTTEQDLRYVYGRYINWSSERQKTVFDVRLMQSGRMKGQAFVGFPSEKTAARALRDTNGYQLAGKPLVVHFARTAKAKPSPS